MTRVFWSLDDVTAALGVPYAAVAELVAEGRLAAVQISGTTYVHAADLHEFVRDVREAGRPA